MDVRGNFKLHMHTRRRDFQNHGFCVPVFDLSLNLFMRVISFYSTPDPLNIHVCMGDNSLLAKKIP